jgi:hypothetical protein
MPLEEFQCDPWSLGFIGHWFKESLVKHNFILGRESGYALGYASPPSLFIGSKVPHILVILSN